MLAVVPERRRMPARRLGRVALAVGVGRPRRWRRDRRPDTDPDRRATPRRGTGTGTGRAPGPHGPSGPLQPQAAGPRRALVAARPPAGRRHWPDPGWSSPSTRSGGPVVRDGRVLNRGVQALLELSAALEQATTRGGGTPDPVDTRDVFDGHHQAGHADPHRRPRDRTDHPRPRRRPGHPGPRLPAVRGRDRPAGPPPGGHHLLPRRRLGHREPRLPRRLVPAPGRGDRVRGGGRRLPPRPRAPVPGRRRRLPGRLRLGPAQPPASWAPLRAGRGDGRQRRGQPGRRGVPRPPGTGDVPAPVAQGLVYPALDARLDSPSMHEPRRGVLPHP